MNSIRDPFDIIKQAIKKVESNSIFDFFGGDKYNEAYDSFTRAINLLKIKRIDNGNKKSDIQNIDNNILTCYKYLIKLSPKIKNDDSQIGLLYMEASKYCNVNDSYEYLENAIIKLKNSSTECFDKIANCYLMMANNAEYDDKNIWVNNLLQAITYFKQKPYNNTKIEDIYKKIIKHYINNNEIENAIDILNILIELCNNYTSENLKNISLTKTITMILLCYFTTNDNPITICNKYLNKYPFYKNRFNSDYNLICDIIDCIDNNDVNKFTYMLQENNSTKKISDDYIPLLTMIKNKINTSDENLL